MQEISSVISDVEVNSTNVTQKATRRAHISCKFFWIVTRHCYFALLQRNVFQTQRII